MVGAVVFPWVPPFFRRTLSRGQMNLTAYTDGACREKNPGGLLASAFVVYVDGDEFHQEARVLPERGSNNLAEYTALLDLLHFLKAKELWGAYIFCDSKLVVCQVNGDWNVREEYLQPIRDEANRLLSDTCSCLFHIRGHQGYAGNELADRICNEVLDQYQGKRSSCSIQNI
jgi:ribonuclease HI